LRDRYDAVLVGRNTLERDDPLLTMRLYERGRDPVAVVVDGGLRAPLVRRLWSRAKDGAAVIVACRENPPAQPAAALRAQGVTILECPSDGAGRVDLAVLFQRLAERGLNSVIVEGGEAVITSVLNAKLARRAHVFVAPSIVGGRSGPRLAGDLGIARISDAIRLERPRVELLGEDVLVTGTIGGEDDVHWHRS
jgi:diaminohydroxyphosphoribosylaminopyrimidine deaminase/5-amino-6-(5-phosphoribosylamino)uracil reductase